MIRCAALAHLCLGIVAQAQAAAPTISGTPPATATVGTQYTFTPRGYDADGDTLTYSIVNLPGWMWFNSTSGRLSGNPLSRMVGKTWSNISIRVSDGSSSTALAPFSITVKAAATNSPPAITGVIPTTATVGKPYFFKPTATDPDGDSLAFGIANKPVWLSFSKTDGSLWGTPTSANTGTFSNIVISVADGNGGSASLGPFGITVSSSTLGNVTLTWTAPTLNADGTALTDLAGFVIAYRKAASSSYTTVFKLPNPKATSVVIEGLGAGTWYFAMKAYNVPGIESAYTSEVHTTL